MPMKTTTVHAAHYTEAARIALTQARVCRDESLRRCVPFDCRIERAVMRQYAMEWRDYTRLARRFESAA